MNLYKHYSFDLWMTLIKSNPSFKKERANFFEKNFNYKNKSIEEIASIFRQVDEMCNSINEKTGGNIDAEEMYLMVINIINDYTNPFQNINVNELYNEMECLVFKYLPVVYSEQTKKVLTTLKESGENSLNVLSNTAFIKGRTLREVLKRIELDSYFDFQLYSDEEGMSKPNKELFQLMLRNVSQNRKEKIDLKEIIHIGDNPKADIWGANLAGINSLLINSNNETIIRLLN
jgi:putative hydrolase of the HAD superfamily